MLEVTVHHLISKIQAAVVSLGSRTGASEDGGDQDRDPSASTEPMFNFRSLAEVVGVSLDGEHAGRRLSRIEADKLAKESAGTATVLEDAKHESHDGVGVELVEDASGHGDRLEPLDNSNGKGYPTPPEVTITPETPAPAEGNSDEPKQLGYKATAVERHHEVTQ